MTHISNRSQVDGWKKFFVRVPSSISQCGGKTNRTLFWSMAIAMDDGAVDGIKVVDVCQWILHSNMSNIIPLPFKTTLSTSYTDVSELAQVMQCLEHHLAHVVNIRITSKCNWHLYEHLLTPPLTGLLELWPVPLSVENFQMWELMGCLELENHVIDGMMSQLHLVCNYNNMLIKWWDPGHIDTGNGWAAAMAWEQE